MLTEQTHTFRYRKALWEESPVLTLFILLLAILVTEALIILFIHSIAHTLPLAAQLFLNSILLVFILFPLLYTFVLNPLLQQISLRRQSELALDKSEENSRILIASLRDLTWEIDANLNVSHLGAALSSFLGYEPDEAVGAAATQFLTPASQQMFWNVLADAMAEQQSSASRSVIRMDDFELLRKDNSSVWTEITATVIFDENHQLERIVGVFRDISDRKLAEKSLLQANELLQKTIASLDEAVFIVDATSRTIQKVNICAEKMFGYSREELIGAPTAILHLDDAMYRWFGAEIVRAYGERGCFQTNYRMKRKDGSVFPSEHYVSPIVAADGSYQSHVCVVRDISERVRAEEALAEAFRVLEERKTFVESIITNLQSGIVVTDRALRITMVNPYVQNICRLPAESIVGTGLQEFCPEIAARIDTGVTFGEIPATFNGTALTIGFTLIDMKNANREMAGYIVNFRDMTEIVKIRSEIKLKERLSAMGEVVARVAHEMRNPLFGMTTVGQILDMELALSPAHQQLMDSFMKESRRLNNLVQDLLDGTRELRLHKRNANLVQVIKASVQICQVFLQEKEIVLTAPPADGELRLLVDPERIEQVLVNLIHNAIEASDPGGTITITLETAADTVSVILCDSGHGIPEKILPNIFELFFTSKKSGTGMGLSISRNIAEAHGGSLSAVNIPGSGAKFTLTLPHQGDAS